MKPIFKGYLSLVLHAHLPYVRHSDRDDYMEERWFFEAMTETYLPLLDLFDRLHRDNVPFRLTMTFSPTLLAMMEDSMMIERYTEYLLRLLKLSLLEMERNRADTPFFKCSEMYNIRLSNLLNLYTACGRDVISKFRTYQDNGSLEIITCAATHAFLPLIKNRESIRAQIKLGVLEYERHFGRKPQGIWLPECAYDARLSSILKECGLSYFIVDHHGIEHARPAPARELSAPVMTPDGIHAFARDPESSRQVWSSHEGYPGDPDYREYYRDIGYDLGWKDAEEWEYIKPFILPSGARINTGMKYYRVSGKDEQKQPYVEEWAKHKASIHAAHFLDCREEQIRQAALCSDSTPLIVCPYDAELFGHWWYEGPLWIELMFRNAADRDDKLTFVTPSGYLQEYPVSEQVEMSFSTWGRNGYAEVWLQPENDWIYRHLHQAEDRLLQLIKHHEEQFCGHPDTAERILNQAVRELMLAQSSDWAFILDSNTVPSYAMKRTNQHLLQCHQLLDMIEHQLYDIAALEQLESAASCFPSASFRLYLPDAWAERPDNAVTPPSPPSSKIKKVLMLAWEFPPLIVGGLSRAVYDLSRHLLAEDMEVHVVTRDISDSAEYELYSGIHVHRVPILQTATPIDFMDWVLQLNLAIADHAFELIREGHSFDFVHAHDWLVYYAAKELKDNCSIPLIATIHATEHGRNHGQIHTDIQHRIHQLEQNLTSEADHVIVCSQSMAQEIETLFALPKHKLSMIPNGVEINANLSAPPAAELMSHRLLYASPQQSILFYIGRLVYEKGIQVLIEGMPFILQSCPDTKLIIAGTGPMKQELMELTERLGLSDVVTFAGFVDDEQRNRLFHMADVCVFPSLYEPFGIVALEAMRSGTPVVVSDTGGLGEIIDHGIDGYKALPGHLESLVWHVSEMLLHRDRADQMAANALQKVKQRYNWETIAVTTRHVYEGVIAR